LTPTDNLRLHIEPYLGHYPLAHLTPPVIRQFEDDLRAGREAPMAADQPGEPFQAETITGNGQKGNQHAGTMLADMQERGLATVNAVHGLRKGRKRGKERQQDRASAAS
jgi:hypothetical protein